MQNSILHLCLFQYFGQGFDHFQMSQTRSYPKGGNLIFQPWHHGISFVLEQDFDHFQVTKKTKEISS